MHGYNKSGVKTYIPYNDNEAVKDLDLNIWPLDTRHSGGTRLYEGSPVYGAISVCSPSRNPEVHYIYGLEKDSHPDHSSRFGYGRCPLGYCSGNFASGFYNAPLACQFDPQPSDMAPKRFYTSPYQGRNRDDSQATEDWNNIMKTFNGPFIY
jgi:hypothetical protein